MNELGIKPEHECFDLGHVGSLCAADRHGRAARAAARRLRHGRHRRHPRRPRATSPRWPTTCPTCDAPLGRDRHLARAVDAARRRALARRLDPRRPGGQLLPARRRDGALQRRADRQGARDDRGRGPPAGDGRRRRGRCSASSRAGRRREPGCRSRALKVLDLTRLLPGGFCSLLLADFGADVIKVEDTGMGDYIRWSPPAFEGAEETAKSALFLSLNRGKRSIRIDLKSEARSRRAAARWSATPTSCWSPSGRACSTGSASATSACARRTRGSSTARSPATARTAPTSQRSGHDMNYLGLNGVLALSGERRRPADPGRRARSPTSAAAR